MDRDGPGGGSLALAELIDDHGPALVADFQSVYGLRLAEVLFAQSPREVFALVEGLIAYEDGLFVAQKAGGEAWREFVGWGKDRHMMADLWDLTMQAAHSDPKKKAPHYPRPESKKQASGGVPLLSLFPSRGGRSSL